MTEQKHPASTPNDDPNAKPPQPNRAADDLELPTETSKRVTGGACVKGDHLPEAT